MGTKTLLDGVNEVLKRAKVIDGENSVLTSLSDSARQTAIDISIQIWNELVDELLSSTPDMIPEELASSDITLVTGQREYDLPTDLVEIRWPLIDQTNGQWMEEYPGGYECMFRAQTIPADYTGFSNYAVINPATNKLRLERAPTSSENGLVYVLLYDKDTAVSAATDTFPFSDAVFRALVPAATELWRRDRFKEFNAGLFTASMGRAARLMGKNQTRRYYSGGSPVVEPFDA